MNIEAQAAALIQGRGTIEVDQNEAAEIAGVHRMTWDRWRRAGKVRVHHVGQNIARVRIAELVEDLAAMKE